MTAAIRLTVALFAATAIGTVPARAQSPAPAPATPLAAAAVLGTWRGPFVTDGPTGIFVLTIEQEAGAWKVTMSAESEGAPPGSDVRDFKLEGNVATWAQSYGDMDVSFKATLSGDVMRGTLEAFQAGAVVGGGSFELKKQP